MQFYNAKCDVRMQNLCRIGVCALSSGAGVFCHQSSRLCTATYTRASSSLTLLGRLLLVVQGPCELFMSYTSERKSR